MIIRSVTAHSFGPLRDETLDLADGLTIIYGRNESAKSSWHAAIYAALCGRRRGGGATAKDRHFAARHKPWDRDGWLVSAEIRLDDGRRVELRQDLDRQVDCHAKDLDLGTDYSAEIMNDGMPDAARWLGLDRSSFVATALVRQAQMLAVMESADGLQSLLQRAADTAGDATAAGALSRIDAFRTEHVGREMARSVRPLPRAVAERQAATAALDAARTAHAEMQRRQLEVDRLRAEAATAVRTLARHEAAAVYARAQRIRAHADEAAALEARLGGVAPSTAAADAEAALAVAETLAGWRAAQAAVAAISTDDTVEAGEPPPAGDHELWQLASLVEPQDPSADSGAARVEAALVRLSRARRIRSRGAWCVAAGAVTTTLGAASALSGIGASVTGPTPPWVGWVALALGIAIAVIGLAVIRGSGTAPAGLDLAAARAARQARLEDAARHQARRDAAIVRCRDLGLPADPDELRRLARTRAAGIRDQEWQARAALDQEQAGARAQALARRLELDATTATAAVDALTRWQGRRAETAVDADRDRRDWERLSALIGAGSVAALAASARAEQERVDRFGFDLDELCGVAGLDADRLARLRHAAGAAERAAAAAEGSLDEVRRTLADVAEAEERFDRAGTAERELRVLDATLARTRTFLVAAQERAHRDVAPVLAESVRGRLSSVTAGRYTDVIVDPAELTVEVCGPARRWRQADRLSHGTAEQVYLLLRIALAEHLPRPGERCPLILDDVIVHADGDRAQRLLELLAGVAADRQIILFTHQARVREWARLRLTGPQHALRELDGVATV
jgi:hypothetical protein